MAAATVITALYGGFDRLRPQAAQDTEVEWLCFTDDPELEAPAPWQTIVSPPCFEHPCMAAKWHKLWPVRSRMVWIDANMQVTAPSFAREALAAVHDGIAIYRHPRRDCIYAEAEASLGSEAQGGKYDGLPIAEQVAHYRAEGHPAHAGLYACGVIAWDGASPQLGTQWLAECERWSYQDQLSFPVVCRRLGIEPGVFAHRQIERRRRGRLENRWLRLYPHL